jgi:hypothetical protein
VLRSFLGPGGEVEVVGVAEDSGCPIGLYEVDVGVALSVDESEQLDVSVPHNDVNGDFTVREIPPQGRLIIPVASISTAFGPDRCAQELRKRCRTRESDLEKGWRRPF